VTQSENEVAVLDSAHGLVLIAELGPNLSGAKTALVSALRVLNLSDRDAVLSGIDISAAGEFMEVDATFPRFVTLPAGERTTVLTTEGYVDQALKLRERYTRAETLFLRGNVAFSFHVLTSQGSAVLRAEGEQEQGVGSQGPMAHWLFVRPRAEVIEVRPRL